MKKSWSVYILECRDGTLYTGATNDIGRRMAMHAAGRGAKYVRARGFGRLVHVESARNKSAAMVREAEIKKFKRHQKLSLLREPSP